MSDAVAAVRASPALSPLDTRRLPGSTRSRRSTLERTGFPRRAWGEAHVGREAAEWRSYLSDLCARVGLVERPVPRWSREILRQAGRAHLVLCTVQALMDAEAASPTPSRQEARRLRSECRRALSSRTTLERTLGALVREHAAATRAAVPSVREILGRVGAR